MSKVMIQLRFPDGKPSIEEVAARLGLDAQELDSEFGVIATDPPRSLYTVLVDAAAAERAQRRVKSGSSDAEGIFSNPQVAPFWPPEE